MSLGNKPKTNKTYFFLLIVLSALIPAFIYFYFLQWKTGTIYGDDLYIVKTHEGLKSFSDKIGMPVLFGKYRPVHGLGMHFLIEVFQKNIGGYYIFNIGIQAINAFLFALIANLFLKSPLLSLLFGLTIGLSRFSFFNVVQLLNGGALEGLAMTFFLAALFFLIRALVTSNNVPVQKQRDIIWSIIFANLSMYTHERYIVFLPFIMLMILLYPGLKLLPVKQKSVLIALALASIVLNVVLKKAVYNMPFFMGTASTAIQFSFSSAISFFSEAVLSIFQLNSGPEYLIGIKFTTLPFSDKFLIYILVTGVLCTLVAYLLSVKKSSTINQKEEGHFWLFISLMLLFGLFLIPAVITIRLEQRWLQASYCIFVLMFIVAYTAIPFSNNYIKNGLLSLFFVLLLWVDFNYLNKGGNNLYMADAERTVGSFERAIHNGTIRPETKTLYVWDKQIDANSENAINWELAEGYFFNFYQNQDKKIIFIDSNYQKKNTLSDSLFMHFNKATEQIVSLDSTVMDITNGYLMGSSKYFWTQR